MSISLFASEARTIFPLQPVEDKAAVFRLIDQIYSTDMTNLTAGWMLGRDELRKAEGDMPRRLLLLSDGLLNMGITDPLQVRHIVETGLEKDRIRTSCLGFGHQYNEDLMAALATATNGTFYDANSPEKLPAIFAAELEGLQRIAVQNLRVRFKRLDFCESAVLLSDYPWVPLPDNRVEISMGDLVGEEVRTLILALEVSALPTLPDGQPVTTLEGEKLVELEIAYDLVGEKEIQSKTWTQTVRVLPVQRPQDVRVNENVIPWVATQRAGKAVEEALQYSDEGRIEGSQGKAQGRPPEPGGIRREC